MIYLEAMCSSSSVTSELCLYNKKKDSWDDGGYMNTFLLQ